MHGCFVPIAKLVTYCKFKKDWMSGDVYLYAY